MTEALRHVEVEEQDVCVTIHLDGAARHVDLEAGRAVAGHLQRPVGRAAGVEALGRVDQLARVFLFDADARLGNDEAELAVGARRHRLLVDQIRHVVGQGQEIRGEGLVEENDAVGLLLLGFVIPHQLDAVDDDLRLGEVARCVGELERNEARLTDRRTVVARRQRQDEGQREQAQSLPEHVGLLEVENSLVRVAPGHG